MRTDFFKFQDQYSVKKIRIDINLVFVHVYHIIRFVFCNEKMQLISENAVVLQ